MLKRLAVGGMAELFLARDTQTDALIVIKRILPYLSNEAEFVQMFLDEARIAAQLDHPNVVQVHELGKLSDSIFIAMEFVDGIDLRKILQEEMNRQSAVPAPIAAWVIARTCDGLYYAHNRKGLDGRPLELIHRDVSPQNVMVGYDGKVKLVDFGIAKANSYMERSQPGVIKGKFLYLSPEQLSQQRLDHRADLFAVGTMLYEVTTGKSPFYKNTTEAVILAIRGEEPPPPHLVMRDYPMELSRIVMKCLTKDRTKRYQQADEIAYDLDEWLATQPVPIDAARTADYVAGVFGDEGERTVLHIPKNAASQRPSEVPTEKPTDKPEVGRRSGAKPTFSPAAAQEQKPTRPSGAITARRDSEMTNPVAQSAGKRVTAEHMPAAGAQFEDDDPRTQMASSRDMANAFTRGTPGGGVAAPPQRRTSGQNYPTAGAPPSANDAEHTSTNTGHTGPSMTPSVTPSTSPENTTGGMSAFVQEGPVFDSVDPQPEPSTRIEGSRAERIRASKSSLPAAKRRPSEVDTDADDASITGSDASPFDDDDDSSTVAGGRFGGLTTKKLLVIGGIAVVVAIAAIIGVVRMTRSSTADPGVPAPHPVSDGAKKSGASSDDDAASVKTADSATTPDTGAHATKPDSGAAARGSSGTAAAGSSGKEPGAKDEGSEVKPASGGSTGSTGSAVALLTEPLKRTVKVPVIFKAPNGTAITSTSGRDRYVPSKTYRLDSGVVKVKYKCPGRRGASGTKAFSLDDDARKTQSLTIACKRR